MESRKRWEFIRRLYQVLPPHMSKKSYVLSDCFNYIYYIGVKPLPCIIIMKENVTAWGDNELGQDFFWDKVSNVKNKI